MSVDYSDIFDMYKDDVGLTHFEATSVDIQRNYLNHVLDSNYDRENQKTLGVTLEKVFNNVYFRDPRKINYYKSLTFMDFIKNEKYDDENYFSSIRLSIHLTEKEILNEACHPIINIWKQDVFLCNIPLITNEGKFIIEGREYKVRNIYNLILDEFNSPKQKFNKNDVIKFGDDSYHKSILFYGEIVRNCIEYHLKEMLKFGHINVNEEAPFYFFQHPNSLLREHLNSLAMSFCEAASTNFEMYMMK